MESAQHNSMQIQEVCTVKFTKTPFTFLPRYRPRCVCARLNRFFLHLVGRRFTLYLEQTCGSGQEQVKTLGSSGAHTAQFGQKLTCQKSVYRAMATGDIRVIDLLVHNTKHTQHSPLGANYYLQCKNITIQCLNLYKLLHFVSLKWVSFYCFLSVYRCVWCWKKTAVHVPSHCCCTICQGTSPWGHGTWYAVFCMLLYLLK